VSLGTLGTRRATTALLVARKLNGWHCWPRDLLSDACRHCGMDGFAAPLAGPWDECRMSEFATRVVMGSGAGRFSYENNPRVQERRS
jgi:hypothetical protein